MGSCGCLLTTGGERRSQTSPKTLMGIKWWRARGPGVGWHDWSTYLLRFAEWLMNLTWRHRWGQISTPPKRSRNLSDCFAAHTAAVPGPELDMIFFIVPVSYWGNNSVWRCTATHGKYLFLCRNIIMTPTQWHDCHQLCVLPKHRQPQQNK